MGKNETVIPFIGVQRRQESSQRFDVVLARLLAETGAEPASLTAHLVDGELDDQDAMDRRILPRLKQGGFLLLGLVELGAWLQPAASRGRIMRLEIGNPLVMRSMMQRDPWAGLSATLSLLVIEHLETESCSLSYVVPSTMIVIDIDQELAAFAKDLDRRIYALASLATASS